VIIKQSADFCERCVADATDDLANQQIFSLAGDFVDSSRIVGVFTKCDRTQHPETVSTPLTRECANFNSVTGCRNR
jgi:hypothetical protein